MSCNTNITLNPVVYGNTWDGLTDCSFTSDGTAFASPLALVEMEFTDEDGAVGLLLTSANATAAIDDANAWEFTINPVEEMTLTRGIWTWAIRTTDDQDVVKTRLSGTIEIV